MEIWGVLFPIPGRINAFLDRVSNVLMPLMLGLVLLVDAIKYLLTGVALF